MRTFNVGLTYKELFILDHALKQYISRSCASEEDLKSENNLLDRINTGIKQLRPCKQCKRKC